jgi:glycosyltransferase involved in cell wall biosynthesis
VLFVIPSLADGGAERVAVTVLSALDPATHERTLYLFKREGVYFERIAADVKVVVATESSRLGRLFEFVRFLRTARPDVVMPFLSYFITAVAVWMARIPARVIFNQGTPTTGFLDDPDFAWRQPWRRRLFAALTRFFYVRADAVVVTSQGVADDLADHYGVPRSRLHVLHNPVDLDAIRAAAREPIEPEAASPDAPVVVAAGRLAGVKNYPLLLEALADLTRERPIKAWILGEGSERASLEALARAKGLGERVSFLGFQTNPWRYIARADIFVLTSTYEGFGNVLVEAMACGIPVIATPSPGTVEIIRHGANGLLVNQTPAAVSRAISQVLTDQPLRQRLVTQAEHDVQHYALPRVASRYAQLFREVCA